MSTSVPPPLLNYVYTTTPNPLQVSTNGTITVVASNPPPGTYAPAGAAYPNNGYVAVSTLVFDFGTAGSGESDLCSGDASTWTVTAPAGWSAPTISGLQLTFTAPSGGSVSPADNLSFLFSSIPVNATVGVFSLTITETAYTPGDPENPTDYPAIPSQPAAPAAPAGQTGSIGFAIGKFPQGFSPSFSASPVNVEAGSSTTLSWSGLPAGCNPSLSYGTSTLSLHADGTLFQPTDTYPDIARTPPDPLFTLEAATIFTLLDNDTPAYSSQVVVGVNYPNPVIQTFTVAPDIIIAPVAPLVVTLTWAVANGAGDAPVTFTITPPLTSAESADNFFNTAHTASGSTTVNLIVPHQITLTVAGQPGTTAATQTNMFGPPQPVNVLSGSVGNPLAAACLPDGSTAFVTTTSSTVYVVDTSATDPTQWSVTGEVGTMAPTPSSIAVAAPSAGYGPFVVDAAGGAPWLSVAVVSDQSPSEWPVTLLSSPSGWQAFMCVAASVAGNHVFAGMLGISNSNTSFGGVAIYTVNSASPSSWPVTSLTLPDNASVFSFAAAPNGDYVCAFGGIQNSSTFEWTLWVIAPSSGTLLATLSLYSATSSVSDSLNLAISPDGNFGILCDPLNGLRTLDLSSSDPTQWTVSAADTSYTPSSCAFSTDGSVAVLVNNEAAGVTVVGPTASTAPSSWPVASLTTGIGPNPQSVAILPGANFALIPCIGTTASNGSLTVIPLP